MFAALRNLFAPAEDQSDLIYELRRTVSNLRNNFRTANITICNLNQALDTSRETCERLLLDLKEARALLASRAEDLQNIEVELQATKNALEQETAQADSYAARLKQVMADRQTTQP